jgi:hypothetical protein
MSNPPSPPLAKAKGVSTTTNIDLSQLETSMPPPPPPRPLPSTSQKDITADESMPPPPPPRPPPSVPQKDNNTPNEPSKLVDENTSEISFSYQSLCAMVESKNFAPLIEKNISQLNNIELLLSNEEFTSIFSVSKSVYQVLMIFSKVFHKCFIYYVHSSIFKSTSYTYSSLFFVCRHGQNGKRLRQERIINYFRYLPYVDVNCFPLYNVF